MRLVCIWGVIGLALKPFEEGCVELIRFIINCPALGSSIEIKFMQNQVLSVKKHSAPPQVKFKCAPA